MKSIELLKTILSYRLSAMGSGRLNITFMFMISTAAFCLYLGIKWNQNRRFQTILHTLRIDAISEVDSYKDDTEGCLGRGAFGYGSFHLKPFACSVSHHNVPEFYLQDQFEARLDNFLDCLLENYNHEIVSFTITDRSYRNGLRNYAQSHIEYAPSMIFFIVALDDATIPFLLELGIPFIRWHGKDAIGNSKVFIAKQLLERGKQALFSEMDVYWSKDPRIFFSEEYDVEIAAHRDSPNINYGFFKVKDRAILVLNAYMEYAMSHVGYSVLRTEDQRLFDRILRFELNNSHVRWRYLEYDKYYHNPSTMEYQPSSQRVVSHLSWGLGDPSKRMLRAQTLDLWIDPWYFTESFYVVVTGDFVSNIRTAAILSSFLSRRIYFPIQYHSNLFALKMQNLACNFDYVLKTSPASLQPKEVKIVVGSNSTCTDISGVFTIVSETASVNINQFKTLLEMCDSILTHRLLEFKIIEVDFDIPPLLWQQLMYSGF